MNFLDDIQQCERCQRFCNREHFAIEYGRDDTAISYLYCEECNRGWECLWQKIDGRWKLRLTQEHGPSRPELFAKFLENLRAASRIAA